MEPQNLFPSRKYRHSSPWKETSPLASLKPESLERDKCNCSILNTAQGVYKFESSPCHAIGTISARAHYFTLSILVEHDKLISNTVFLDQNKQEVFRNINNQFERVSRRDFTRDFNAGKEEMP